MNKSLITLKHYIKVIFVLSLILLAEGCKKDENPVSTTTATLGVCPPYGLPGITVRISGIGIVFTKPDSTYQVRFNGVQTTVDSISFFTRKTLFVKVPQGATNGIVTVTNGGQTLSSDVFNVLPPVKIASVVPVSAPIDFPVVITGQNFDSTGYYTIVKFGNVQAGIDSISSTKIYLKVPPGAATGQLSVIMNGITTNARTFTVTNLWNYANTSDSTTQVNRIGPTTTLLPDGRLFMVGGKDNTTYPYSPLASSYIYDPVTGQWTFSGNSSTNRYHHTATSLLDGRVLVTGGTAYYSGGNTQSLCDLFDPSAITWNPTDSLSTARQSHTATRLPNGKILVAGGISSTFTYINGCELYDPAAGQWTSTGNLNTGRDQHSALLLPTGKVLVIGGRSAVNFNYGISSCELYDTATGQWTPTGSLHYPRNNMTAVLLANGKVLVSGGLGILAVNGQQFQQAISSCELYDPATGQWTVTGSMSEIKYGHAMVALPNGKAIVTGGYTATNSYNSPNGESYQTEVYDPTTGKWSVLGGMTDARAEHTMTLLANGKLIVIGGYNSQGLPIYYLP